MLGWGTRKQRAECKLIVDIRSASVGAALVVYGEAAPSYVYGTRVPIDAAASKDAAAITPAMLAALAQVGQKVVAEGLPRLAVSTGAPRVTEAVIAFAAPWYTALVHDISVKKEKPFILTRHAWKQLLEEKLTTVAKQPTGYSNLEHDITRVMVNGYELKDPFHKKVQEMLIALYTSFVSEQTKTAVAEAVQKHFHGVPCTYKTMPLISFTTLRDMFWNVDRFTFFDVGGLVTEVGVVEGGTITHIMSVPYGSQHMLQAVQAACSMDDATLTSAMSMLAKNELHPSCTEALATARTAAEQAWVTAIRTQLDVEGITLPPRVFVQVAPSLQPIFGALFGAPQHRKTLFGSDQEIQVAVLTQDHVRKYIDIPKDTLIDPFMLLTALFLRTSR
ncbi:MAG: hypothetical protein RL150_350 [Candidatus Parcubacteria bacterium]|jgi:hypothetical protein